MARVRLSNRAERDLKHLPPRYAKAVAASLRELADAPPAGKPLRGEYAGLRSRRVGAYRIIYFFDPRKGSVEVISIEHRSEAYR